MQALIPSQKNTKDQNFFIKVQHCSVHSSVVIQKLEFSRLYFRPTVLLGNPIFGLRKNAKLAGNFKKGLDWRNELNFLCLNNENSTHRLTLLMWKYFSFCASIHDSSWFCSNRRTTDCWHSMQRIDLKKRSETALDQRPPQHEGAYHRGPKSP